MSNKSIDFFFFTFFTTVSIAFVIFWNGIQ